MARANKQGHLTDAYVFDEFYRRFLRVTREERRGILRGLQTIADAEETRDVPTVAEPPAPEPTADDIAKLPLTDAEFAELAGGVAL